MKRILLVLAMAAVLLLPVAAARPGPVSSDAPAPSGGAGGSASLFAGISVLSVGQKTGTSADPYPYQWSDFPADSDGAWSVVAPPENCVRVKMSTPAGTPMSTLAALVVPPASLRSIWRFYDPIKAFQLGYYSDPSDSSAPTDFSVTKGGEEFYVFCFSSSARIGSPPPTALPSTVPVAATSTIPSPTTPPSGSIATVPPSLSLSVPTVTAGNTVTVTGQAFPNSGTTVTLTLTSQGVPIITLGTATVSQGGFSTTVTVAASTGPSSYQVHAQSTSAQADASLQVTAPGSNQTLTVTDSNGVVATSISSDTPYTLTGTNFAPGFGVTLFLDSKTGPQLGTATAGQQNETFTISFDVTAAQIGNQNGHHALVVVSNGFVVAQVNLPFVVLQGPH